MADTIATFFDGLQRGGHNRFLEEVSGVIRFDLEGATRRTTGGFWRSRTAMSAFRGRTARWTV